MSLLAAGKHCLQGSLCHLGKLVVLSAGHGLSKSLFVGLSAHLGLSGSPAATSHDRERLTSGAIYAPKGVGSTKVYLALIRKKGLLCYRKKVINTSTGYIYL